MTVWDSGLYNKTTNYDPSLTASAIIDDARVVIYATIWSVIYDPKPFIVQATDQLS